MKQDLKEIEGKFDILESKIKQLATQKDRAMALGILIGTVVSNILHFIF